MPDVFDTLTDAPANDIFDLVGPEDSPTPAIDKQLSLMDRAIAFAKSPSPEMLRKPEEAVRQYVKGMVPGDIKGALRMMNVPTDFNSPEQLTQFVFPMLQPAIQTLEGIKGRAAQIQEAEKTPPGSQERWNAGIGTVLDLAQLATMFKGGELIGERAPVARPEEAPATPIPPEAQTQPSSPIQAQEGPSSAPVNDPIVAAANRAPDGRIFTGVEHFESSGRAQQAGVANTEAGFVTKSGTFLNPEQAHDYAIAAKQVSESDLANASPSGKDEGWLDANTFNQLTQGEPTNAQQPSNAQVEARDTALGVEARPQGDIPSASSSDNVVGETGGEKPLMEGTPPQTAQPVELPPLPKNKPVTIKALTPEGEELSIKMDAQKAERMITRRKNNLQSLLDCLSL